MWVAGHLWAISDAWYDLNMAHTEQVTIGDRGRIVLPSNIRSALGLVAGMRMLITTEEDGSLRLRPYRTVAEESRGLFADLNGGSLVDELVAERRAEASREK
jgi:AbrB family looped-hinge helix DNA binding protein